MEVTENTCSTSITVSHMLQSLYPVYCINSKLSKVTHL